MPHPHKRTWTLEHLSRDVPHLLWFDDDTFRWECRPVRVEVIAPDGQASEVSDHVAKRVDEAPTVPADPLPSQRTGVSLRSVPPPPGGC